MNYRIVKTAPFKVFGLEGIISTAQDEKCFSNEGAIWKENHRNGKYEQLFSDAGSCKPPIYDTMFVRDMCRINGLMNYKKINDTTYGYMQFSFVTPDSKTDGYTVVEIQETTWAVFPSDSGMDVNSAMSELNKRFYSEWLPTSEYEKADAPELEMYGDSKKLDYFELWMPIVKK